MKIKDLESLVAESLRDWFKKEKWVRISSSGNIAGPCGTSKNKKNPDRCLPMAKAKSLSKSERAATAKKKKESGSKGKQFVSNTKKAKVTRESLEEMINSIISEKDDRCTRIAKSRYDSWPSAYASGAVVRCRKGEIWKDVKEQEDKPGLSAFSREIVNSTNEYQKPAKESEVDSKELEMGVEVEMEHTNDAKKAKIIALQHLAEDPKYYTKLKRLNL